MRTTIAPNTGASRPSRAVPGLTIALLVANLVAAVLVFLDPDRLERWGFHPEAPSALQALSSLFVHANTAHLLGNLVFLAAVGAAVELAAGPLRFGAVYALSGLGGVGLYWLACRRMIEPPILVGASGCVAGCAAYYAIRYHGLRVVVAPGRALSLLAVVVLWLFLQAVGAVLTLGGAVSGRAFFAHLGGALVGLLLATIFRAPDLGDRRLGHEVLDRMNDRGPDAIAAAARNHLAQHPDDPEALARLAEALRDLGEPDAEADARLRLVRVTEGDDRRLALSRLLELDPLRLAPRRRLQMADLVGGEDRPLSARLLNSVLNDPAAATDHPDALLALAALSTPPDAELLARLESEHPMSPAAELARRRGLL